jgi:hypothetical protein
VIRVGRERDRGLVTPGDKEEDSCILATVVEVPVQWGREAPGIRYCTKLASTSHFPPEG